MRYLALIAVTWIVLGFVPSAQGQVMTAAKWLGWPLLVLAAGRFCYRLTLPARLLLLLAAINQLLFFYQLQGFWLSPWSLSLCAVVLLAPALHHLYQHPGLPKQVAPFVFGILFIVLLGRLFAFAGNDQFGRLIHSFPFGYKTELAALLLLLLSRVPQQQKWILLGVVAVILGFADSRAGLAALPVVALGWRNVSNARRWFVAIVLPLLLVVLAAWWGDPSAQTRLYLWGGALHPALWFMPAESSASFAASLANEAIRPLLVHGTQVRIPLHLHNDILQLFLIGVWLVPWLWWKRRSLRWPSTGGVTHAMAPLVTLLLLDSLISRPLGLLVVGITMAPWLYEHKEKVHRSKTLLYGPVVLVTFMFCLMSLQAFVAPGFCSVNPVMNRDAAIACVSTVTPSSVRFRRLAALYRGTRRWTPDGTLVEWLFLKGRGKRQEADKLRSTTMKNWGLVRSWPYSVK